MKLSGKVTIVTGGGSGIGRATALLFAEEGARVVVADWNSETGMETVADICTEGREATFCHTDVSKAREVEKMVGTAVERYGKLNVLFNNAAIQVLKRLVDTEEEEWERVHSVNLKGVFLG